MNNIGDTTNKEPIKQMLSKLSDQTHPSPEMVLAYARGALSQDGRSKIALHIKDCKECAEILTIAKESLRAEEDLLSQEAKSKSVVPISPQVAAKLKLVTTLNSKKDDLTEKVAKLLLPKDSWVSIKPTIVIARSRHKYPAQVHKDNIDELPVAAFSSGVGEEGRGDYEVVMNVINFIDIVHDLILERCKTVTDIKSELPACVDDAIIMLDGLKLDEEAKKEILKVLSKSLSTDEK